MEEEAVAGRRGDELNHEEPEPEVHAPWDEDQYQRPPTGRERWSVEHAHEGWLVRRHGQKRQRPFVPILATVPIRDDQLLGQRVTVAFDEDGRHVIRDQWTTARPWTRPNWTGYTFIQ